MKVLKLATGFFIGGFWGRASHVPHILPLARFFWDRGSRTSAGRRCILRGLFLEIRSLLQLFVLEEGKRSSAIDGLRGSFLLSSLGYEDTRIYISR